MKIDISSGGIRAASYTMEDDVLVSCILCNACPISVAVILSKGISDRILTDGELVCRFLLKNSNNDVEQALNTLCKKMQSKKCKILDVVVGKMVSKLDKVSCATLVESVRSGNASVVALLLTSGKLDHRPLPLSQYCFNEDPLHDAISLGRTDLVKMLIDHAWLINHHHIIHAIDTGDINVVRALDINTDFHEDIVENAVSMHQMHIALDAIKWAPSSMGDEDIVGGVLYRAVTNKVVPDYFLISEILQFDWEGRINVRYGAIREANRLSNSSSALMLRALWMMWK